MVKGIQRRGSMAISYENPRWQGDLDCHECKSGKKIDPHFLSDGKFVRRILRVATGPWPLVTVANL